MPTYSVSKFDWQKIQKPIKNLLLNDTRGKGLKFYIDSIVKVYLNRIIGFLECAKISTINEEKFKLVSLTHSIMKFCEKHVDEMFLKNPEDYEILYDTNKSFLKGTQSQAKDVADEIRKILKKHLNQKNLFDIY